MFNPFYVYIYSFMIAFILYLLNFSTLYPDLSTSTILFFIVSFVIAYILGRQMNKKQKLFNIKIMYSKKLIYITVFLFLSHILEFVYTGYIPLLGGGIYTHYTGIPTFHVIVYTFNIFFSVFLFQVVLDNPKKVRAYLLCILTLIPSFLIMSRGMLINILIGCLFVLLYKVNDLKYFLKKHLWKLLTLGLVGLYLFGVSGNIRNNTINQSSNKLSNLYIMEVGGATEEFRKSIIPKEYFWSYLYISSPLANLEKVIQTHETILSSQNIKKYFANEVTMDFIAKRIFPTEFNDTKEMQLISDGLTVGTGFRGSYYYLGWSGIIVTFIILMGLSYLYSMFLSVSNPFRIVGIAMLSNVIALFAFDNMITYSGMSFQLFYPLIWEIYLRVKPFMVKVIKNREL